MKSEFRSPNPEPTPESEIRQAGHDTRSFADFDRHFDL
jgi:hypothetical protein